VRGVGACIGESPLFTNFHFFFGPLRVHLIFKVELVVNLDRACVLEETGKLDVRVGRLFPKAVSPRNLAIYAWPKAQS